MWIQTGRGVKGSIFVNTSKKLTVYAKKVGKTVGGLQIWELVGNGKRFRVYLKRRTELREVIKQRFGK